MDDKNPWGDWRDNPRLTREMIDEIMRNMPKYKHDQLFYGNWIMHPDNENLKKDSGHPSYFGEMAGRVFTSPYVQRDEMFFIPHDQKVFPRFKPSYPPAEPTFGYVRFSTESEWASYVVVANPAYRLEKKINPNWLEKWDNRRVYDFSGTTPLYGFSHTSPKITYQDHDRSSNLTCYRPSATEVTMSVSFLVYV